MCKQKNAIAFFRKPVYRFANRCKPSNFRNWGEHLVTPVAPFDRNGCLPASPQTWLLHEDRSREVDDNLKELVLRCGKSFAAHQVRRRSSDANGPQAFDPSVRDYTQSRSQRSQDGVLEITGKVGRHPSIRKVGYLDQYCWPGGCCGFLRIMLTTVSTCSCLTRLFLYHARRTLINATIKVPRDRFVPFGSRIASTPVTILTPQISEIIDWPLGLIVPRFPSLIVTISHPSHTSTPSRPISIQLAATPRDLIICDLPISF